MFAIAIFLSLSACESTNLPKRNSPEKVGITQRISKDNQLPDEYVFCDQLKGAWKCPTTSIKTPISKRKNDSSLIPLDTVTKEVKDNGLALEF